MQDFAQQWLRQAIGDWSRKRKVPVPDDENMMRLLQGFAIPKDERSDIQTIQDRIE